MRWLNRLPYIAPPSGRRRAEVLSFAPAQARIAEAIEILSLQYPQWSLVIDKVVLENHPCVVAVNRETGRLIAAIWTDRGWRAFDEELTTLGCSPSLVRALEASLT